MKKQLILTIALLFVLAVCSCGDKTGDNASPNNSQVTTDCVIEDSRVTNDKQENVDTEVSDDTDRDANTDTEVSTDTECSIDADTDNNDGNDENGSSDDLWTESKQQVRCYLHSDNIIAICLNKPKRADTKANQK